MKECILEAGKTCDNCGTCDDRCELDPNKICDNCFRCLELDQKPYLEIPIAGVFLDDEYVEDAPPENGTYRRTHASTLTGLVGERRRRLHCIGLKRED